MINKQSVYMVRHGEKKIKKISLKKLINAINHDSWTKTFSTRIFIFNWLSGQSSTES